MDTKQESASTISKTLAFAYVPLLALLIHVFFSSPLSSPNSLDFPSLAITSTKESPWNNKLQEVTKLGEGILYLPEDIVIDEEGALVTATRDGWIKKMHRNGTWEYLKFLASDSILGIANSATPGHFLACVAGQKLIKLGEGNVYKPEDIRFDGEGTLYAATRDGWIKKMYRNGTWEDWMHTESDALLGLAPSSRNPGHVLVCDVHNGLIDVSKEGVKVLASHATDGSVIRFADDLVEASDGKVYFSDASRKFVLDDWYFDLLEAKPYGRILVYDPTIKETSVVLDGLYFPNGVALSQGEEYLITCETWKYRCLKYFLKGEKKGTTEILVENLPGGPDNVRVAPDGTFWIACIELRLTGLGFAHTWTIAKHILATYPKLIELTKGIYKKAMVVNVGTDGKIIRKFDDSNGKVISYATSVLEFEDHIYIGSLTANFVGKLPLK